jgi:hypothetical protein
MPLDDRRESGDWRKACPDATAARRSRDFKAI